LSLIRGRVTPSPVFTLKCMKMRCDHRYEPQPCEWLMKTGTRRSPAMITRSERLSGSRLRATSEPRRRVKPAAPDEPLELCPGCDSVR
jgi:hypothetical protein